MLSILRKTASSMAKIGGSNPAERYDVVDLSTWEFVDASLSDDDDDLYSFDGDDVISASDGVVGADEAESQPAAREEPEDARATRDFVSPDDVIQIQTLSASPPMTLPVEMVANFMFDSRVYHGDGDSHDVHDDDDDVDDGDYDDELLPWKLKDRFGKQRIKKLGKRGGPKLNKSKRMPHYYNRPGCLYGKHGYGVQHSFN